MATIHIIAIEAGHEPHVLRLAAEAWGATVTVTWVGNAQQIVTYFASRPAHDLIFIAGHGDARGLLLPTLAPEVQQIYPYHEVITPADFGSFLRLDQSVVVNLACVGGMPAFAAVFRAAGARAYLGPLAYPHGDATLMYALELIYAYLQTGGDIATAHQQAIHSDDDRQQFCLYQ